MPDEFGGVAVEDEPVRDEFGGVALGPGEQPARDEFGGVAEEEAPSAWSGVPGVRATMTPGGGFSIGSAELAQARREARLLAESRAAEPESLRPVLRPPRTDENATLAPTIEEAQSQRIVQETVGPLADRAEEFKELYFAPLGGETPKLGEDWILKAGVSPQARAYRTLVAGGERSVAKVLDFARSPFGLETLGLGMVPGVGRAIAVGFIGDMIAHAPDIGARFVEAVAEGDGLGATEAAADALLTGVFVKGLGRAGFGKYGKAPLTELPGMVKADLPQARARLADALTRLYDVNRPVAGRQAGADVERPTIELDPAAPLTRTVPEPEFNEFGGETTVPETPLAGIPPTPSKPATDEIGTLKDPPEPVVAPEVTETTEVTRRRAIQRVTARRKIDRETEQFGPDVIDWLADNGGVISRAQAKRLGRLATNRDLWDGQPEALAAKHHEFIYETSEHGMMPDEAATGAAEAGVIKTAKVDSLWDAVDRASKARVAQQKQLAAEEAELTRQGAAALKQAKAVQGLLFEIRNAPTPETVERILQRPDAQGIYQAAGEAGQETLDAATRERVGSEQVSERVSGKVGESLRQFAERLEDLKKAPDDKLYAMGFGGVGRAVFNTALDLAAAALRAGAPLAEAVEKALAHIRANFRGEWSEATARLELERELTRVGAGGAAAGPGQRERKLFPRLQAAPFLSAEVKAQITERFYTVESLKGSEAAAAEVLDQIGPPAAAELALNPPLDFPKAVAGALASVVNKEAAYLERQATDPAVKREWQEFQADFNNRVLHAATGAGQWIASLKILSQSTPDGVVLTALRLIEDGVQRHVASYSRLLDQARTALNRAQETAAQDTLATPAIQDGARGAIGAALAADPEVHRFIAAEVVGALSQVPEVRRQITAKIRALLAGELRKQRTGEYWQGIAARGAGQLLKAIEKGLAPEGRAPATVDQFGSELTRILQQQINAALGVTPEAVSTRTYLQRLTTLVQNSERLSQVWGQVREQAARKYETEIRELEDLRQHSKLTDAGLQRLGQLKADWFGKVKPLLAKPVEVWSQQLLTATIRERLHEMTVRVSALAQQPDGSVAFGKLLADRISAATGLDEVSARSLNAALEKAYVDMVKAEKDKLAARIEQAQQSARERAARLRQSRSTWQRTKQGIAERLAKLLEAPSGEKPTALEDFGRRLAATLRRQLEPLAAERPEAARLTDIEAVREGITNADKYEDVWRQTQQEMREAWAKNPDGLALLDTFFRDVAPEPFALSTMDRLLRTKLREWNVRLGDAARKGQTGALRGRLGDALVKEGGLTGAAADKLRDAINKRFDTLATARKQKLLEQLLKPELPKTQRTLKLAFDRLAELNNIGALDQPTLAKIVAEKLGLKAALTPEQTAELRRLAEEMQAVPEGQLHKRQRLAQRIQSRIKQIGETRTGSLLDLAIGVWYSDVLSGLSNLVNLSGNLMQALASTSVMLGRNPRSAPLAVASLRGALGRAAWDGLDVLARGPLPHRTGLQVYGERRLERLKGWERVLTPLRYIGRALDAGDVIFHDPHEDMRFALLAALEARKSGLRGEALVRQVREQLHSSPGELAEARLQAAREGYQGSSARQRAHEIVHSRRDERLTRSAQEYARDTVYRGEPYGVLGALAKWMNEANRRWRLPIAIAPFPTLVSNFFNEAFNYVPPVAAYRLWKARPPQPGFFNFGRDGTLRGRPLDWTSVADQQLYYDQRAKLLVGLVGWSALNAAFSPRDGEDDKEWAIYGRGPRDAAKRKTWLAAGGKSNTIKLGGTSFDYSYWPIAPLLAVLGNWHDTLRWHRDDTTAGDRLAFGIWNTLRTVLDTPVLSGLARTLDVIEEPSEKGAAKKLAKFFAGPLAGFVPARGALSVIDRINDPQVYDGPGVKGAVLSQIPFARSHAAGQRPVLNGLGEPVRVHVSERFAKTAQPDATWSELARLNIGLYPRTLSVRDARGDSRDLSEEEIYQVVKRSGPRIRAHLERALAGADWQKRPDDYKRRVIEAYVQAERTAAKLRVTGAME